MMPISTVVAYRMYLTQPVMRNSDIQALFGIKETSAWAAKKPVIQAMAEKGICLPRGQIHTETAFEVWGIDVDDLEARFKKTLEYCMEGRNEPR